MQAHQKREINEEEERFSCCCIFANLGYPQLRRHAHIRQEPELLEYFANKTTCPKLTDWLDQITRQVNLRNVNLICSDADQGFPVPFPAPRHTVESVSVPFQRFGH